MRTQWQGVSRGVVIVLIVLIASAAHRDQTPLQASASVGFGTMLNFATAPLLPGMPSHVTYADFTAAVDDLAAHGQQWVRTGVGESEMLAEYLTTGTTLVWQEPRLAQMDQALAYVHARGMRTILLVGAPVYFTGGMAQNEYLTVVSRYYGTLAQRWATAVDVWEVGNESNLGDFRERPGYNIGSMGANAPMPTLTAAYVSELAAALGTTRTAIHAHTIAPMMTSIAERYAIYNQEAQDGFFAYLDALGGYVDAVDLHMYDGMDPSTVDTSLDYLVAIERRYGKPLYITEFGEYGIAGNPTYTEAVQVRVIAQQVHAFMRAGVVAAIQFQWKDESIDPSYLGLLRTDGTRKPAYATFFAAQLPPPAPAPSPRPVPAAPFVPPPMPPTRSVTMGQKSGGATVPLPAPLPPARP
ncbi:MAG: hypothetical protein ACR2JW_08125 [Thermomicrobiales bacterium]